jgi:hypothetical protein
VVPRQPGDELLLLATDGVFAVLSNAEAAEVVRRIVRRAAERGSGRAAAVRCAASALARYSRDRGSRDDITVVLVDLAQPAGQGQAQPGSGPAPGPARPLQADAAAPLAQLASAPGYVCGGAREAFEECSPPSSGELPGGRSNRDRRSSSSSRLQRQHPRPATAAAPLVDATPPIQAPPGAVLQRVASSPHGQRCVTRRLSDALVSAPQPGTGQASGGTR